MKDRGGAGAEPIGSGRERSPLERAANDHLWLHFTQMGSARRRGIPIIAEGRGCQVKDIDGKEYIDALSGLFAVQIGYGREELARVAAEQMERLSFFHLFGYANPPSIELAEKLADLAPGDLSRVFFTTGGSEAVESALKLARHYWRLRGYPGKYKFLARKVAYHGTTYGALSVNGISEYRIPYEPLLPEVRHAAWTNCYRCEWGLGYPECEKLCLRDIERTIEFEGPETIAAIILEPVQNGGGSIVPPPDYFAEVRALCDRHDILLISDEVICSFGRLGDFFGCRTLDYLPDIVTLAKGMSSGYQPCGGMVVREPIFQAFVEDDERFFAHGITFGGHPVACAVALENIRILQSEQLVERAEPLGARLRQGLESLLAHPVAGDVRGMGLMYSLELVKDKDTRETFNQEERDRLIRDFLSPRLYEMGLICRADDRGDPVITLAPPLVISENEIDRAIAILDQVLAEADRKFL